MSDRGEAQAAPEAVPTSGSIGPEVMQSAGGQLRAARQAQGLHIVHLAAMLKVAPSRLEALEANRFDAMPDMVYARALLSSACRCMKIDPEPMLALLPQASVHPLQVQSDHLNQAFHEHRGGGRFFSGSWRSKPLNWLFLALVLAIILVLFWPRQKPLESAQVQTNATQPQEPVAPKAVAPAPATDQPAVNPVGVGMGNAEPAQTATPGSTPLPSIGGVAAAGSKPSPSPMPDASKATATTVPTGSSMTSVKPDPQALLSLQFSDDVWLMVTDAKGVQQVQRTAKAGEVINIMADAPLAVVLGRADKVEVRVRGAILDISAWTQGNVARFEVK